MPIEIQCTGCAKKIKVPDRFAGLKARCPSCQSLLDLPGTPLAGTEVTAGGIVPDTAVSSSTSIKLDLWLLRTVEGEQYGPVSREDLNLWVEEGRVDSACDVKSTTWPDWRPAAEIYPELRETPPPPAPAQPAISAPAAAETVVASPPPVAPAAPSPLFQITQRAREAASAAAHPTGQFAGLRLAAQVYGIAAWILAAMGVIALVTAIVVAALSIAFNPSPAVIALAIGQLLLAIVSTLVGTGLAFVTLRAAAEFIQLMIDIHRHTRIAAEGPGRNAAGRDAAAHDASDGRG